MTIKELFKLLEDHNKYARAFHCKEEVFGVDFDECNYQSFSSYKDFVKFLKEEYTDDYVDMALTQLLENDGGLFTAKFIVDQLEQKIEFWRQEA